MELDSIQKVTSLGNRFVDWHGKKLLDCDFSDVQNKYGAPYYFVHRADFIKALVAAVEKNKSIQLRMGARVTEYDFATPRVRCDDGWLQGDLLICADGIKSSARNEINGRPIEPVDTGDVAYRILVPAKPLLEDPEMREYILNPWAVHWMGPEAHAVGYPLRGGELYNIIIDVTHRTDLGKPIGLDEWRSEADNAHLMNRFKEWCSPVRKLCGLTGTYLKWKLADFDQLDRWVHPGGRAALLGDACHPMMPYMAQGAAQATEDAASLAAALREFGDDVPKALQEYQDQRLPRAAYVARNTRILQEWLHLHDGDETRKREDLCKSNGVGNPIFWGGIERRDWLFGHDATKLGPERIPEFPPLPRAEARVYKPQDGELRIHGWN